jgi:hypothetical protein
MAAQTPIYCVLKKSLKKIKKSLKKVLTKGDGCGIIL